MSYKETLGQANIGRVWMPHKTVSLPGGGSVRPAYGGTVVASCERVRGVSKGLTKGLLADVEHPTPEDYAKIHNLLAQTLSPENLVRETVFASVTHNERVDRGASIQINRVFGTVGQAAAGVFVALAVGGVGAAPALSGAITKTKTDLSMGVITISVTTNEHTTIGLSRAAGTPGNLGAAPGALDGVQSLDVVKSFAVTGTGDVRAAALFDSTTVAASNLYVEDNFAASVNVVNTDTLNVTWTISM